MKTTKLAISNSKGGCGKTTTVMNLGAAFAAKGKRVLLVDLDPQHHLSTWLGYKFDNKPTATEIIFNAVANLPIDYEDCIRHSTEEDLDYIPSSNLLAGMLSIIAQDSNSSEVLNRIFSNELFSRYDYIIFDCQTALDLLVTNVLKCCDKLLIPVQADLLSYEGVKQMLDTFIRIKNEADIKKYLLGMLVTMYHTNTTHSARIYNTLKESYNDLVFEQYISYRTEAKNAVGYNQSSVCDKNSTVGKQYIAVADLIMEVCENE